MCFLNRALLHASVLNLLVPSFITGRTQSYHTFLFLICTVPHSYQGEPYHRSDLSSVDPSPEKSSLFVALRLECFLTSHVRVRKRFLRPITDPEHPRGVARKKRTDTRPLLRPKDSGAAGVAVMRHSLSCVWVSGRLSWLSPLTDTARFMFLIYFRLYC